MTRVHLPAVHAAGRTWPAGQIEAMSAGWRIALDDRLSSFARRAVAVALPLSAEGVSLFIAASAGCTPVVAMSPDPQWWPGRTAIFESVPLVLPPSLAALADEARTRGFEPVVLDPPPLSSPVTLLPLQAPGVVVHTSGSTGAPKPVYRPMAHLLAGAATRCDALGLHQGEGLAGGVPLSSGQGLVQLVSVMYLGGALGIVGALGHRDALAMIGDPAFGCWRATAHFADVLGRCPLNGPPRAPRICLISSAVANSVHRTFTARFGVPLRGAYSSTETGAIAVDAGPAGEVRPGTVGRPITGVEVRIGDDPRVAAAPGTTGRIWVRSPWQMTGYGIPPVVSRPGDVDGFWPTQDLGMVDADGFLTLSGRADDCVRTRDGRLVNLEVVAAGLRGAPGVGAAVVVPLAGAAGTAFG
ncbi:MAG TPA: AMP-binding protein, partial [Vicinamibacterales bacterium]|nr:AMP-binding protein [Vicinamibacterales bacterium]